MFADLNWQKSTKCLILTILNMIYSLFCSNLLFGPPCICCLRIQGGPKKQSTITNHHWIVLKYATKARFFISFDYKMSTKIQEVCIKYSTYELICNVITCCVLSCDMGKINGSDKIMSENQKIRENLGETIFLHKSPSKRSLRHRIHSLLRRADARGSANIIYRIWRISPVCRSGAIEVRK